MKKPCILCVAITGSLPTKADNPAVPISLQEQIESTQSAFEAGATIAHCHVRNQDQTPSSDPEKFAALLEGLKEHCPGMVIQFSLAAARARELKEVECFLWPLIWLHYLLDQIIFLHAFTKTRLTWLIG